MLPHCAVHMLRTISLHFSRAPLNGCGFWDGPIVFQRLHASPHPSLQQAFCGMPPLTSQPFGVTRGLGITESEITQHRLYNVPLSRFGFLPGLGTNENLQWQWPPRGIPPAGRVFLGKILGIREQLAASHVNSQSLLNTRTGYPRKQRKVNPTNAAGFLRGAFSLEKTRNVGAITASHVNLQSPWTQEALSFEKHMESGRVSATHVLVEKRYGIRERLVACHMNLQSHWTQDAFYLRKHKESEPKECGRITWGRIFVGKRQGMWARSTASHINLQSPWTQEALSFEKHMESGRVSATHVLVEKRYGIRERLVACHMNLQSQWTQDAFYLRKHKESGGRYNAHFHWKTQGVGRGRSSVTYKFTVKMKPRGNLYGIHNDFCGVGGGLRRGCILIRNRD